MNPFTNSINSQDFINDESKRTKTASIVLMKEALEAVKYEVLDMALGQPNLTLCPLAGITFHMRGEEDMRLTDEEMDQILTYGPSIGLDQLLVQLHDIVRQVYHPPQFDEDGKRHSVMVTAGNTDAANLVLLTLIDPGRDAILFEGVTYSTFLTKAQNYGAEAVQVDYDEEGYLPSSLKTTIESWREKTGRTPKLLYVVPHAANPTGASMGEQRIRDIYKIASEYNLLILEDDPYYFVALRQGQPPPSVFLSVDVDGRVIRLDSFAKILAPGLRLGFLTAAKSIVNHIVQYQTNSTVFPCEIAQLFVARYLQRQGVQGFLSHSYRLSALYDKKREIATAAANEHLTGLCEWKAPKTGMFFWLKLKGVEDTLPFCMDLLTKHKVSFTPGADFLNRSNSPYIRLSYSKVSEETIKRGVRILGETLRARNQE